MQLNVASYLLFPMLLALQLLFCSCSCNQDAFFLANNAEVAMVSSNMSLQLFIMCTLYFQYVLCISK